MNESIHKNKLASAIKRIITMDFFFLIFVQNAECKKQRNDNL